MQRRAAGIILLCISAFIFGIRYLSAAIYGSNVNSWGTGLFNQMLGYIGNVPVFFSWLAFFGGIGYLFWAEFEWISKLLKKSIGG